MQNRMLGWAALKPTRRGFSQVEQIGGGVEIAERRVQVSDRTRQLRGQPHP